MHLSVDELLAFISGANIVGQGSMGILYELGQDEVFKFNYKDFIDEFAVDGNKINLRKVSGDVASAIKDRKMIDRIVYRDGEKEIVKAVRKMADRRPNMKHNTLPKGVVYVQDYPVGFILERQYDMVNLYEHIMSFGLSEEEVSAISQSVRLAVRELADNNIYHFDLTARNILYNPNTMAIQIVDFEDSVRVCDSEDRGYLATMTQEVWAINKFMKNHMVNCTSPQM